MDQTYFISSLKQLSQREIIERKTDQRNNKIKYIIKYV